MNSALRRSGNTGCRSMACDSISHAKQACYRSCVVISPTPATSRHFEPSLVSQPHFAALLDCRWLH